MSIIVSEHPEFKVILASAETGRILGEVAPKNLQFSNWIRDIDNISFDMNLSHRLSNINTLEAYATDYILMHKEHHIQGGIITAVGVGLDDRFLNVAGSGYKHYFERRFWPFNPSDPTGNIYIAIDTDQYEVLTNILDQVLGQANSLTMMYDLGQSGILINYRIEPGDTESILEKFNDLSEQSPGFDYEIHVDITDTGQIMRELMVYSPRKTRENTYIFQQGRNMKDMRYTGVGVRATHVIGMGAGSSRKVAAVSMDHSSQAKYRRLDHAVDLGAITDGAVVQRLTTAERERLSKSKRSDLRVVAVPEPNVDLWVEVELGDVCRVQGRTEYETVDDYFRVVGFEVTPSEQGDEEITVVFENAEI